jgi:hypothetical protein
MILRTRMHLSTLILIVAITGIVVGLNVVTDPPLQLCPYAYKGAGSYYGWPVAWGFRSIDDVAPIVRQYSPHLSFDWWPGAIINILFLAGILRLTYHSTEQRQVR